MSRKKAHFTLDLALKLDKNEHSGATARLGDKFTLELRDNAVESLVVFDRSAPTLSIALFE